MPDEIEDEEMYVAFATLEEMPRVCELERGEFEEGVASSSEKMLSIFARNPQTFLVLKKKINEEICGFASVWPVTPKFVDDLIFQRRDYTQILAEEVRPADYGDGSPTDYYIDTVMVTNPEENIIGAFLLIRRVEQLLDKPVRIVTVSVTPFGRQVTQRLGMHVKWRSKKPIGADYHYCCLVDTSGPKQQTLADRILSTPRKWRR
jgi:hypothetical protein